MVLHFLNNFFAVILYFIVGDDELFKSNVSDAESLNANVIYFFILLLMFITVIFIINNYYRKIKTKQEV